MPSVIDLHRGFAEIETLKKAGIRFQAVLDVNDALAIAHLLRASKVSPMPKEAKHAIDSYLTNLQEMLDQLGCPALARAVTE